MTMIGKMVRGPAKAKLVEGTIGTDDTPAPPSGLGNVIYGGTPSARSTDIVYGGTPSSRSTDIAYGGTPSSRPA